MRLILILLRSRSKFRAFGAGSAPPPPLYYFRIGSLGVCTFGASATAEAVLACSGLTYYGIRLMLHWWRGGWWGGLVARASILTVEGVCVIDQNRGIEIRRLGSASRPLAIYIARVFQGLVG